MQHNASMALLYGSAITNSLYILHIGAQALWVPSEMQAQAPDEI